MEQEKFELQKKHTDNIQELLEDTNQRLAKMEAEYVTQARATVSAHSTVQTDLDDVHFAPPPVTFSLSAAFPLFSPCYRYSCGRNVAGTKSTLCFGE